MVKNDQRVDKVSEKLLHYDEQLDFHASKKVLKVISDLVVILNELKGLSISKAVATN